MPAERSNTVILVNPVNSQYSGEYYAPSENIELGYIASVLREAGADVVILDLYNGLDSLDAIREQAARLMPLFVCTWGILSTLQSTAEACAAAKAGHSGAACLTGGRHSSFAAKEILGEFPAIDGVFIGEGERGAVDAFKRLKQGKPVTGTAGLVTRDGAGAPARAGDLDALPLPARDITERLVRNGAFPAVSIAASRGCYGRCSFCCDRKYFSIAGGVPWRGRGAESVADEIEGLLPGMRAGELHPVIYFADSNFIGPGDAGRRRTLAMCAEFKRRKLKFSFEAKFRPDSFYNGGKALEKLVQAGLSGALVGIESASPEALKVYNKLTSARENAKFIKRMRKLGLDLSSLGFIMFNPYSTPDELAANARLLRSAGQMTLWNLGSRMEVLPGADIRDKLKVGGLLKAGYNYRRVFDYEFADPRTARIFESVNFFGHELRLAEDSSARHLMRMHSIFEKQRKALPGIRAGKAAKAEAGFRECLAKLNGLNLRYFSDAVRAGKAGRNMAAAERARFVRESARLISAAVNGFRRYAGELAKVV